MKKLEKPIETFYFSTSFIQDSKSLYTFSSSTTTIPKDETSSSKTPRLRRRIQRPSQKPSASQGAPLGGMRLSKQITLLDLLLLWIPAGNSTASGQHLLTLTLFVWPYEGGRVFLCGIFQQEEMLVALFCFFSLNSHLENWGFACNDSPIQPPASQTIQFMQDNLLEQVEFKVILQFNEHNLLRIFKILHLLRATLPTMWGKKLPRDNAYRPGGTQSQKLERFSFTSFFSFAPHMCVHDFWERRPRLVNGAPWGS
ncbi:unnamed protein product [Brassica rapa subsp. narinosa]